MHHDSEWRLCWRHPENDPRRGVCKWSRSNNLVPRRNLCLWYLPTHTQWSIHWEVVVIGTDESRLAAHQLNARLIFLGLLIAFTAHPVEAKSQRSQSAVIEFKHSSPCPSTGKSTGRCPGYVVDHVSPLACGGADSPYNMQWQSKEAAKEKDKWERKGCR
jgi:hypothetical protein